MLQGCKILGAGLVLAAIGCSSADPSKLMFSSSNGPSRGAGAPRDAGATPTPTPTPQPSPPSSPPPPIVATDASAGGVPVPADAAPPPATPPSGSCGAPKCGATSDGCGCAATTDQGDVVFLGCNDQGCVCGHGQTVDQQFSQTGACDSEATMLAAWQSCTCP